MKTIDRIKWNKNVLPSLRERLNIFQSQGIEQPTLRSMFYALYSLGIVPNTKSAYQSLSRVTARDREDGQLPIDCFADQSRQIIQGFNDVYESPEDYVEVGIFHLANASNIYHETIPRWYGQPEYVEVWTEKDASVGTFRSILGNRQVLIVPTRGFSSVSFDNSNFQRWRHFQQQGKNVHILYFGDLDPSGESISSTVREKFNHYGIDVDFQRIAVTEQQMTEFNLPRNPDPETLTKLRRDPRRQSFMNKHNGELFQIEIDALQAYAPLQFRNLVQNSVDQYFDEGIYQRVLTAPEHSPQKIDQLVYKRTGEFLTNGRSVMS
jgi:hypothetical protein